MARFVKFAKARRSLDVLNRHYREQDFESAAVAEARSSAVWAKFSPGLADGGDLHLLIDLDNLPVSV